MYIEFFEIDENGTASVHTCERRIAQMMIEDKSPRYACILGTIDEIPCVVETLIENDNAADRRTAIETAQFIFG